MGKEQKKADGHRRIADAGDDEGLACRTPIGRVFVPEADEQVAAETHALPAQVEKEQVVGQHQDQHEADEEVHVGEEPAVALIVAHELGRIEVDEKADPGDDQDHDQGKGIQVKSRCPARSHRPRSRSRGSADRRDRRAAKRGNGCRPGRP